MRIAVDNIQIYTEESVDYIWLGQTATDPIKYFMIQYDNVPDDQEKRLGMDTYYVEIDDQGRSGYGGIDRIELDNEKMIVHFDDKGIEAFGLNELLLSLPKEKTHLPSLVVKIERIFNESFRNKAENKR